MSDKEIIKLIKKHAGKEFKKKLFPKKSFVDLGIDSLKTVELIANIEKKFSIRFKDKDLGDKTFKSLNNFINIVKKTIKNEKKTIRK